MKYLNRVTVLIALMGCATASPVLALPSDQNAPLNISSDAMQYNHTKGVGHYVGHVKIDRGTSQLDRHELFTYNNKSNQLSRFVAKGDAHYQTITELGKPPLKASADVITYDKSKDRITLKGDAKVTQGKNHFTGPVIYYNPTKKIVTTPKSKKGRTHIVIAQTKDMQQP